MSKANEKRLSAAVVTLGCRVNQYESDAISEILRDEEFEIVSLEEGADVVVINTCAVTGESERKSRQLIRKAVGANPAAAIIVSGCYAQIQKNAVSSIEGVDYVCGNGNKNKIPEVAKELISQKRIETKINVTDIMTEKYDGFSIKTPSRLRSYVKIEDGCNNKCSYCVIPTARGKVRSKKEEDIINEVSALSKAGCREIILTGIETASYGFDFKRGPKDKVPLAGLLEKIDALGIERIGLGSLEPNIMSAEFTDRISKLPHILPHFHLSIQSGSSSVLGRMRRKYNAKMALAGINRLKEAIPDVTLSADVIVGFPGESEVEFYETVEFIKQVKFLHLHIFPYSPRPGTDAASMENQISSEIKRSRLKYLSEVQEKIKEDLLSRYVKEHADKPAFVLVEKHENGVSSGHSEHYVEVAFEDKHESVGHIKKVTLNKQESGVCKGTVIN